MIYGYIRVSTDKQTVENQRMEINTFCAEKNLVVDRWVEETVSGKKDVKDRLLGSLLKKMRADDVLIASELSRLGRTLFMIMSVLNECMNRGIKIWTIKDNYRLGDDITCKVLAFAFGIAAEIERNLISQRTKAGLARVRAEGRVLGRPKGSKSKIKKRDLHTQRIAELSAAGVSAMSIGRLLGIHRLTVMTAMREHGIVKARVRTGGAYRRS